MVLYYGLFALQTANNIIAGYRPEQRRKSRLISSDNSWIYTEDLKKRYHDSHYILIPVYTDKNNDHWYFIPWTAQRVKSRIDERSIREHFSHSNLSTYWITNEIIPNRSIPRTKRR